MLAEVKVLGNLFSLKSFWVFIKKFKRNGKCRGNKKCSNLFMEKKENDSASHASTAACGFYLGFKNFSFKTISAELEKKAILCAEVERRMNEKDEKNKIINASCEFFSHQSRKICVCLLGFRLFELKED